MEEDCVLLVAGERVGGVRFRVVCDVLGRRQCSRLVAAGARADAPLPGDASELQLPRLLRSSGHQNQEADELARRTE